MNQFTPKSVSFGGLGVPTSGNDPKIGRCQFNGMGVATTPVLTQEPSSEEKPVVAPVVKKKDEVLDILTKGELKIAIEKKFIESGIKVTGDMQRAINKLNRDPLEAFLNDDKNFIPEQVKKSEKNAEANKAQAEKDEEKAKNKGKEPDRPNLPKEDTKADDREDSKNEKDKVISKILGLQSGSKEEKPMTKEELEEMSLDTLQEYQEELSI